MKKQALGRFFLTAKPQAVIWRKERPSHISAAHHLKERLPHIHFPPSYISLKELIPAHADRWELVQSLPSFNPTPPSSGCSQPAPLSPSSLFAAQSLRSGPD